MDCIGVMKITCEAVTQVPGGVEGDDQMSLELD